MTKSESEVILKKIAYLRTRLANPAERVSLGRRLRE